MSQLAGSRFGRFVPKKVCRVQLNKPGLRATLMFRKSRRITAVNPQACAPNVSLASGAPSHDRNKSSALFGTGLNGQNLEVKIRLWEQISVHRGAKNVPIVTFKSKLLFFKKYIYIF